MKHMELPPENTTGKTCWWPLVMGYWPSGGGGATQSGKGKQLQSDCLKKLWLSWSDMAEEGGCPVIESPPPIEELS